MKKAAKRESMIIKIEGSKEIIHVIENGVKVKELIRNVKNW